MAKEGSINGSLTYGGYYSIRVNWSVTQNIITNTSTVKFKAYFINKFPINKNVISGRTFQVLTSYDHYDRNIEFTVPTITTVGNHFIGSGSVEIPHDDKGYADFIIRAFCVIDITLNDVHYNRIGTNTRKFSLDQIIRLADISISKDNKPFKNGYFDDEIVISVKNKVPDVFKTNIYYIFGNDIAVIKGIDIPDKDKNSFAFRIPKDFAYQIPNSNSGSGIIICETFLGTTFLGANECAFTVKIPDTPEFKPSFQFTTTRETKGTSIPSEWNMYVQNKSQCITDFPTAIGAYGSTISQYKVTSNVGHLTYLRQCWHDLKTFGNITFTGTVIDSRGIICSKVQTITVVKYCAPIINSILSQRCIKDGNLDDEGEYAKCHCEYTSSSCENKNIITTNITYRKLGDTAWKIPSPSSFFNNTDTIIGTGDINTEYTYEVKYEVKDSISPSVFRTDKISRAISTISLKKGGNGIAFGKVSKDENTFEISHLWDFKLKNNILADFVVYSGYYKTSGATLDFINVNWYIQIWNSGLVECQTVVTYLDFYAWSLENNIYYNMLFFKLPDIEKIPMFKKFNLTPFSYDNTVVSAGGDNHFVNWYSGGYINEVPNYPNCASVMAFSANENGIHSGKYSFRVSVKKMP